MHENPESNNYISSLICQLYLCQISERVTAKLAEICIIYVEQLNVLLPAWQQTYLESNLARFMPTLHRGLFQV